MQHLVSRLSSWSCPVCGIVAEIDPSVNVHCSCGYFGRGDGKHSVPIPPSIAQRGINYLRAWLRWSSAGMPTRTDDEVTTLRDICRECEYFDGTICTHKKCGCPVSGAGMFGDKLSWSTEHCPIGKW